MDPLEARARAVLSPVLGHYTWLPVDHAKGSWLFSRDGRKVLDLTAGIAVNPVGHAHPKVVAAVTEQVKRFSHLSIGVAVYEPYVALAEALARISPPSLDTVMFGNSGAEAIEASIKLARQSTGREAIIAFRGGFHGRTIGAASLTTSKAAYKRGYGALLPEVYVAPYPYAATCRVGGPHDAEACAAHCLEELDLMLDHEVPPEHVAAILIEPVLGEGGYVAAPASFLRALRALADRIGALLIFDEVQSGLGRTGAWWAAQRLDVTPDILCTAKALGGGMPLGGVLASRKLHEGWQTSTHGSTFGGNPVSCASGLATLQVIEEEGLVARAERIGAVMAEELAPLRAHPRVRDIRRLGAMVAVEFDEKVPNKETIARAFEHDVLVLSCGAHDQVTRFIPSLNIEEDDLRAGLRTYVAAARAALGAARA